MDKYIERDAFIEWLKKIPMVDLSDGRGLCRVIMEDDFKRAIKNMPESIIHDREVEVVMCKDCKQFMEYTKEYKRCVEGADGDCRIRVFHSGEKQFIACKYSDFCSYGERKDGDE